MKQTILVTGGTGFIGSHTVVELGVFSDWIIVAIGLVYIVFCASNTNYTEGDEDFSQREGGSV